MGLAIYMIWSTPPEVDTGGLNTPETAAPAEPAETPAPGETATPGAFAHGDAGGAGAP